MIEFLLWYCVLRLAEHIFKQPEQFIQQLEHTAHTLETEEKILKGDNNGRSAS